MTIGVVAGVLMWLFVAYGAAVAVIGVIVAAFIAGEAVLRFGDVDVGTTSEVVFAVAANTVTKTEEAISLKQIFIL